MTYKLGLDGKVYASATTHSSGDAITWTEGDDAESVQNEDARGEATVMNRASDFELSSSGVRKISYTIECTYDPDDPFFVLMKAAYENKTVIAMAVMDADITISGTKGFYADVEVFSAPKGEEHEEFDSVPFKVRPSAKSAYAPRAVTIA